MQLLHRSGCFCIAAFWASGFLFGQDAEPLHTQINQLLANSLSTPASDTEFLRRVSLDLNGVPPSADETKAFLEDPAPDRRAKAVDRLLSSLRYARHMAEVLDVMLMERHANVHVPQKDWHDYLRQSLAENKPFNLLAKELLTAGSIGNGPRAAARFYLDRQCDPNLISRDIGRIFLGRDMQCNQCHDHPTVGDYLQLDYQGLLAYVAGGYAFTRNEGEKKDQAVTYYAEKPASDVEFESVFIQGVRHLTGPRLPATPELVEPFYLPGEQYDVAPSAEQHGVPKFSRRQMLADALTDGSHQAFNENIANRLWAHMLGQGIVQPVDFHHSDNPPAHPELLKLLGEQFARMDFNIREFLREIALTEVYQRAIDPPADLLAASETAANEIAACEQQAAELKTHCAAATKRYSDAMDRWSEAEQALLPVAAECKQAVAAYDALYQKQQAAAAETATAKQQLAAKEEANQALTDAVGKANEAVAKVGEDAELKAAAQKFADKLAAVTGELPALKEAVSTKEQAQAQAVTAADQAKAPIEEIRARLEPLKQACRDADAAVIEARTESSLQNMLLSAAQERLDRTRQLAGLKEAQAAVVAVRTEICQKETLVAQAREELSHGAQALQQPQADVDAANAALSARQQTAAQEQAELQRRLQAAAAVEFAVQSSRSALEKTGEDSSIQDAIKTLDERLVSLKAAVAEQQAKAEASVAQVQAAESSLAAATKILDAAKAELDKKNQRVAEAEQQLAKSREQAESCQGATDELTAAITESASKTFVSIPLKPLTPEQLCWSVFQVTGIYQHYWNKHDKALNESSPLTDEMKADPVQVAARNLQIETLVYEELLGNVRTFVSLYGVGAGQPQDDFFATAEQALFVTNSGSMNGWVNIRAGNPTEQAAKAADPRAVAEALYLGVLTRFPDENEVADVAAYLSTRDGDKNEALKELTWGLLTSAEFRFNH